MINVFNIILLSLVIHNYFNTCLLNVSIRNRKVKYKKNFLIYKFLYLKEYVAVL